MSSGAVEELLEGLLDQLVLRKPDSPMSRSEAFLVEMAFKRAQMLIRFDEDVQPQALFEVRLRLALHLAPRSAIRYDATNPKPRWKLIQDYLVYSLDRDKDASEPLARAIAALLDHWQRERQQVTSHRHFLLRRDGPNCSHCHVRFDDTNSRTVLDRDPFKPYFTSPEELLSPEVDHIESVSTTGTNQTANLQLLCRLCNAGKGDGLGIDLRQEALNAALPLVEVPAFHFMRLVYYVIARDGRCCTQCESDETELTMRPFLTDGPLVRSNLRSVCVECAPPVAS